MSSRPFNQHLVPVPESLKRVYHELIEEVDRATAQLSTRLQGFVRCAPGCSSCCRSFSVFPLEAALIEDQAGKRQPQQPQQSHQSCPLLIEQRCSVYAQRPLICRTQGLPIAYVDEISEQIEVSACRLNFSDEHPFELDDLFFIDPFNARLAALNSSYCEHGGLVPEARIPIG